MRVYLLLAAREVRERIPPVALRAARRAVGAAFPVPPDVVRPVEWTAPDGQVALFGWSNEPDEEPLPPTMIGGSGRRLGYCGHLAEPKQDGDLLLNEDDLGAAAAELGGVFAVYRASEDGIEAATSMARVCPVYHAEAAGARVVGSRSLLVHLVARAVETGVEEPETDLAVEVLHPLIRHGFFTNDDTPFRGVRALPAGSVLIAAPGRPTAIRRQPVAEVRSPRGKDRSQRELIRPLAEALVDSVAPLARHREPIVLSLSGGRDGRLMAAVLNAAGVPFTGSTHGFADDPDVILATQVATALGIEHNVDLAHPEGPKESVTVEHPFARAAHVIRMCEGMNSAYESVARFRPYRMVPGISGSGGETLRGGFLYDQDDISPEKLKKRVHLIFHAAGRILTADANARAAAGHRPWAELAETDAFDVLDKLYLYYRTGRWIVGSHSATLMNSPFYHPFFDNRVVREATALEPRWRRSEYPFYLLIRELAPQLAEIQPEGKRWRFDREQKPRLVRRRAWRARAVPPARGRTAAFNWRVSYDDGFRKLLLDQILDGPQSLFDIVDREALTTRVRDRPKHWVKQLWHVYTLSVLLSGEWRTPPPDLPKMEIPIPH
ncbi:asparagine synthase-related protein [Actinomadura syzygii]|uniref:Asparagine synthetase domain-containing protein n=1 Tax=Actinomadura syzygii TaxID=1427538 RepID=A0A5D0U8F2_9ACTN|nr:asparagine synthase-related protein [Actinomadura syzygii]TYC13996.1 hypothetical protein FXF65_20420 [Actinomadura syzygii]